MFKLFTGAPNSCYRMSVWAGAELMIIWHNSVKECCDSAYCPRVSGRKYRLLRLVCNTGSLFQRIVDMQKSRTRRTGGHRRGQRRTRTWPEVEFFFFSCFWAILTPWIEARLSRSRRQGVYRCLHRSDKPAREIPVKRMGESTAGEQLGHYSQVLQATFNRH